MALRSAHGNNGRMLMRKFFDHGGNWVLAQLLILAAVLLLPLYAGGREWPAWIMTAGMMLTIVGLLLFVQSAVFLGRSLTPFPRPHRRTELRTGGLYAWMRHPLYTGVIFASAGWSMYWGSGVALVLCVPLAVFFDRKAAREERWLRER